MRVSEVPWKSNYLRCLKNFVMFSEILHEVIFRSRYVFGTYFFSTPHNLWAQRQNVLVQAVLAWAVGWKSMAVCSEIMGCKEKLKSLICAEYIICFGKSLHVNFLRTWKKKLEISNIHIESQFWFQMHPKRFILNIVLELDNFSDNVQCSLNYTV